MAILVKEPDAFPRERVRLRMAALLKGVKKQRAWTHVGRRTVLNNLMTVSSDLWLVGSRSLDPSSLGSRHLASLIHVWQQGAVDNQGRLLRKPLSRKAAAQLWTAVGHWTSAIGKANIRPPFQQAWPEEVEQAAPTGNRRSGRLLLSQIDEATYLAVLEAWRTEPGRQLNYWLARAVRELGLSVGEAIRFAPRNALQAGGTSIVVTKWAATSQRVVALDTPEKLSLVAGIVDYLKQTQQARLCWPRSGGSDGVESLDAAEVKFRESVRYQVTRIERAVQRKAAQPTAEVNP